MAANINISEEIFKTIQKTTYCGSILILLYYNFIIKYIIVPNFIKNMKNINLQKDSPIRPFPTKKF